jgi:hypothetical protein
MRATVAAPDTTVIVGTAVINEAAAAVAVAAGLAAMLNPAVTTSTMDTTICVHGWTATVRPPATYTNKVKLRQLQAQGLDPAAARDYELDHVVPLALGGAPAALPNLRLQPWAGPCSAHSKDVLESTLHRAVCAGKVPLATAQHAIATDWPAAYRRYVGPLACTKAY